MSEPNVTPVDVQPAAPQAPEVPSKILTSYFHGTTLQLIGWRLLGILLSILTLGIGAPWAHCMVYRWQINHTTVEGKDLYFDGKGHQLLGKYLLWGLLIVITCGIYTIFLPVRVRKWFLKHTSFATGKEDDSSSSLGIFVAFVVVFAAVALAAVLILGQLRSPTTPQATQSPNFQFGYETTAPTVPENTWYVTTTKGLNVRDAANFNSNVIATLPYGAAVQVEYYENGFAYIGYGWVYAEYLSQTKPNGQSGNTGNQSGNNDNQGAQGNNTQTTPSDAQNANAYIIGAPWTHARYDTDTGRLHLGNSYMFSADGTFSGTYTDSSFYFDGAQWIWDYTMGTGGQSFEGTYTFDGSTLVLTYTYMEWENTVPAPRTCAAYVESSILYIDGTPYYTGNTETIGNLLCPNPYSAGAAILDSSIFGTWYGFRFNGDKLEQWRTYTFNSDRSAEVCVQDTFYEYTPETGLVCYGSGSDAAYTSYWFDGTTLTFGNDSKAVTINGNVLCIDGEYYYRGDDPRNIALQLFTQQ